MEGQRGVLRGTTCIGIYLATHGPMDVVVLLNGEPTMCTGVDMATDSLAEVGVSTIYCGLHGLHVDVISSNTPQILLALARK